MLRHIDYLSTVSGGGYIGGSLTTWLHREGPEGRDDVMRELDPARAAQVGSIDEPSPVDRVRSTCRYLAPRGGVVSADVWALVIPILFPPLSQSREGQGRTNQHGAMGVIRYSAVDGPGAPAGTILYLKATLSGDEPVDVRNFAAADPLFPHDSTSNQFFEEARFESTARSGFTRCCQ